VVLNDVWSGFADLPTFLLRGFRIYPAYYFPMRVVLREIRYEQSFRSIAPAVTKRALLSNGRRRRRTPRYCIGSPAEPKIHESRNHIVQYLCRLHHESQHAFFIWNTCAWQFCNQLASMLSTQVRG
jgi:hypothetical protein